MVASSGASKGVVEKRSHLVDRCYIVEAKIIGEDINN